MGSSFQVSGLKREELRRCNEEQEELSKIIPTPTLSGEGWNVKTKN